MKTAYKYIIENKNHTAFAELLIIKDENKIIHSPSFGYRCGSHRYNGHAHREIESEEKAIELFIKKGIEFFKDRDIWDEQVQKEARFSMLEALQPTIFGFPEMEKVEKKFCSGCGITIDTDEGDLCSYCSYMNDKHSGKITCSCNS